MQMLPLYFDLREVVEGDGFVAALRMRGRVTGMPEFGSYWIYGVNPGGLSENGDDLVSAKANFRRALTEVLFDLADRASDFAGFEGAVRAFLNGTNEDIVEEWSEARRKIQAGPVPEVGLRPETAELDPFLTIRNVLDRETAGSMPINELPDPPERLAA